MTMKDQIFALRDEGKSYNQIKEILGCSKGTISYHLGVGQKEKTIVRSKDKRSQIARYIQEYKQANPCTDCGENYPYWIMDLDHLGDKSFTIANHRHFTQSLERVKEEIQKCEVVCANCHRNRTYSRAVTSGDSIMDIEGQYN